MTNLYEDDAWLGAEFLLEHTPGDIRRPIMPFGFLFSARRFSLNVASLYRDITWVAGHAQARVRLSGLATFSDNTPSVTGPTPDQITELRSTWISIQAATERSDRIDYSTLEINTVRKAGEAAVHSELVLYVEPPKFADLMHHLEGANGDLKVRFMLECEDGISLSPEAPSLSIPVYDVIFSLQQSALATRVAPPLLPQLQHVLERCSPDAVRGTTQLETIGEEIALTLGQTVMGEARQLDAEFAARSQLVSWLSDVRATFHGENLPEDAGSEPFFTLSAQEFQTRISDRDPITQFNLMKAYGRVWAHSPIRRARRQIDSKPELDAYSLSPDPDMLEDLAERYCDQSDMHSATLEWCLTNALLRNSVVKLAKQPMSLVPKLRAGAIEVSIQSTLAACAFLLAQSNVLIFWTVFLALNFLRWTSPSLSPALAKRSLKAGLLEQLLTTHDQLAIEDFNAAQVRDTLNGLQTRGAKLPAVLYRLLERRINRINRTNPITKT